MPVGALRCARVHSGGRSSKLFQYCSSATPRQWTSSAIIGGIAATTATTQGKQTVDAHLDQENDKRSFDLRGIAGPGKILAMDLSSTT